MDQKENRIFRLAEQTKVALIDEIIRLEDENELLKKENARLKKQNPKPNIGPSDLEKEKKQDKVGGSRPGVKKSKDQDLIPTETIKIDIPQEEKIGLTFKGYVSHKVQELETRLVIREYLLATYQKSDGTYITAQTPVGVGKWHYGPELRQHMLYQKKFNNVSQDRILRELHDKNISISSGEINRIIQYESSQLKEEANTLLPAGLSSGKPNQTDDTGARHKKQNYYTTVICNEDFAYFKTTKSKSRINFLEILSGKKPEYIITNDTLDYVRKSMSNTKNDKVFGIVTNAIGKHFTNKEELDQFLVIEHKLGKTTCRIITEGALIGALLSRSNILKTLILLSDGALQFAFIDNQARCWIHMERSIKKLTPRSEEDHAQIQAILEKFWTFYRALKTYQLNPSEQTEQRKAELRLQFSKLTSMPATEEQTYKALKSIRDNEKKLLMVLDHPTVPLHNNASESAVRAPVIQRKILGGTRSDEGKDNRDTMNTVIQTCKKQEISVWEFLDDRINKRGKIPPLYKAVNPNYNPAHGS